MGTIFGANVLRAEDFERFTFNGDDRLLAVRREASMTLAATVACADGGSVDANYFGFALGIELIQNLLKRGSDFSLVSVFGDFKRVLVEGGQPNGFLVDDRSNDDLRLTTIHGCPHYSSDFLAFLAAGFSAPSAGVLLVFAFSALGSAAFAAFFPADFSADASLPSPVF